MFIFILKKIDGIEFKIFGIQKCWLKEMCPPKFQIQHR